jgi:hypothetical protein
VSTIKDRLADAPVGRSGDKERIGADAAPKADSFTRTERTSGARDEFRADAGGEKVNLDRAVARVTVVARVSVIAVGSR